MENTVLFYSSKQVSCEFSHSLLGNCNYIRIVQFQVFMAQSLSCLDQRRTIIMRQMYLNTFCCSVIKPLFVILDCSSQFCLVDRFPYKPSIYALTKPFLSLLPFSEFSF